MNTFIKLAVAWLIIFAYTYIVLEGYERGRHRNEENQKEQIKYYAIFGAIAGALFWLFIIDGIGKGGD